jgi:hypothetical protein
MTLADVIREIPIIYSVQARYGAWPRELDYVLRPDVKREELETAIERLLELAKNNPDPALRMYYLALVPVLEAAEIVGVDSVPEVEYPDFSLGVLSRIRGEILECSLEVFHQSKRRV